MANMSTIEAFIGTWDYVEGDNIDEYLKETGVGMIGRMASKSIKPRLVFIKQNEKWILRTETVLATMQIEFMPNIEYKEVTPDGREFTGIVTFENNKWIQVMFDKKGKKSIITRWIDENEQQQIILECGKAKVHRVYRRVE